jgi:ABC transporter family protein
MPSLALAETRPAPDRDEKTEGGDSFGDSMCCSCPDMLAELQDRELKHDVRDPEAKDIVGKLSEQVGRGGPPPKTVRQRRGGDLSSGQQQLAIARVLVTQPCLVILDEPTEGIDSQGDRARHPRPRPARRYGQS